MALFAPVAPIQVLEAMYEDSPHTFGEYHLLLAHHSVAYEARFRRLFERIAADGIIHPTVIMDNSVVECGGYVNYDMMHSACQIPFEQGFETIAVLPDVMGNGQETREAVLEAYRHWEREMPATDLMAVCQGESMQDYELSLKLFANTERFPKISWLGIPRILVEKIGGRLHATQKALCAAYHSGQRIHLLGYSNDMYDDLVCSIFRNGYGGAYGIDSAVPLRVSGYFGFPMTVEPRPKDWFETATFDALMRTNLEYVRREHANQ